MRCTGALPRVGAAVLAALTLVLALGGDGRETVPLPSGGFLTRDGTMLVLDGRPYRFLGYNAFTLTGCGLPGEVPSQAEIDDFFSGLRPGSMVRTWFYRPSGLPSLDRIVAAAETHGVLLVATLADAHGDCGERRKDADWYARGFRGDYLDWVRAVVRRYRDSQSIGMWEPVNEPSGVDPDTLRTFFDHVGGLIHRLDQSHLVSSGSQGPWAHPVGEDVSGVEGYRHVHASPGVDVLSLHEYDQEPGASPWLRPSLAISDDLGKPLIVGEVGVFAGRDGDPGQTDADGRPCLSFPERARLFAAKLDATFATDVAGVLVWNWLPRDDGGCGLSVPPSDPLTTILRDYPLPP